MIFWQICYIDEAAPDGYCREHFRNKRAAVARVAQMRRDHREAKQVEAEHTDADGYCPSEYCAEGWNEPTVERLVVPTDCKARMIAFLDIHCG